MIPPLWFRVMLVAWAVLFVVVVVADARAASTRPRAAAPMLPPSGPFPDAICNEDAAMDIYVGSDGALWECVCQKMFSSLDCAWYEVPTSQDLRLRKRARAMLHVRTLPRLVVISL